ncbi:MAG: ChbG/HpnK family deacetylase, partial [Methylocystis sp.]
MVKEKVVALCADDFGLSYGVSLGILEAVTAGRLTGVSAIVTRPGWPTMGRELARRAPDADIGLHLNLTLGAPLGSMPIFAPQGIFPPIAKVIRLAVRGKLP